MIALLLEYRHLLLSLLRGCQLVIHVIIRPGKCQVKGWLLWSDLRLRLFVIWVGAVERHGTEGAAIVADDILGVLGFFVSNERGQVIESVLGQVQVVQVLRLRAVLQLLVQQHYIIGDRRLILERVPFVRLHRVRTHSLLIGRRVTVLRVVH